MAGRLSSSAPLALPQAREALEALIDLIEDHPIFVRPYVVPVADVMLRVVAHADFDVETRKLALEFLLTVSWASGKGAGGWPSTRSPM